jgi:hypothetical protein
VILHISYRKARVYYEDGNKRPTPEHVEDTLHRMERCLEHIWEGNAPQQINLDEYEPSEGE